MARLSVMGIVLGVLILMVVLSFVSRMGKGRGPRSWGSGGLLLLAIAGLIFLTRYHGLASWNGWHGWRHETVHVQTPGPSHFLQFDEHRNTLPQIDSPSVTAEAVPLAPPVAEAAAETILPDGIQLEAENLAASQPAASQAAPGAPVRPAWVDGQTHSEGNVDRRVVHVGPWANRSLCDEEFDRQLQVATQSYIQEVLGPDAAALYQPGLGYLKKRLIKQDLWLERTDTSSLGPQFYLHALLEFDDSVREDFKRAVANYYQGRQREMVEDRVGLVALSMVAAAGVLGIALSFFKLDTLTKGYYTGRLRFAALAAILGLAAAVVAATS